MDNLNHSDNCIIALTVSPFECRNALTAAFRSHLQCSMTILIESAGIPVSSNSSVSLALLFASTATTSFFSGYSSANSGLWNLIGFILLFKFSSFIIGKITLIVIHFCLPKNHIRVFNTRCLIDLRSFNV
jgi:hypothetical protein